MKRQAGKDILCRGNIEPPPGGVAVKRKKRGNGFFFFFNFAVQRWKREMSVFNAVTESDMTECLSLSQGQRR